MNQPIQSKRETETTGQPNVNGQNLSIHPSIHPSILFYSYDHSTNSDIYCMVSVHKFVSMK
ncbi:hypothetical protein DERF_004577 [Dermatophagoides farinae]|uniref:Uncharacterized protein n=1 Tax=Dermatophagoides farinae TaxID=6954 RepID=A0A922I593_DERFA|nr:hypothetical protein DERF_004577 [Dermatophagoides farinae]